MDIVLLLHSLVRFVLFILALVGIVVTVAALARRSAPAPMDRGIGSAFVGVYDLQALLGLLIILLGGLTNALHPIVMFVGIVVAHGLQAATRQAEAPRVHLLRLALYVVPIVIVLVGLAVISRLPV